MRRSAEPALSRAISADGWSCSRLHPEVDCGGPWSDARTAYERGRSRADDRGRVDHGLIVGTMVGLEYLTMDGVARIPRRAEPFGVAVYAPIDRASAHTAGEDVILLSDSGASAAP